MNTDDFPHLNGAFFLLEKHELVSHLSMQLGTLQSPLEAVRWEREPLRPPKLFQIFQFDRSPRSLKLDRLSVIDSDGVRYGSHLAKNQLEVFADSEVLLPTADLSFESSQERDTQKDSGEKFSKIFALPSWTLVTVYRTLFVTKSWELWEKVLLDCRVSSKV